MPELGSERLRLLPRVLVLCVFDVHRIAKIRKRWVVRLRPANSDYFERPFSNLATIAKNREFAFVE